MNDDTLTLKDGRRLAFRHWGEASGPVVMAMHGSPGSRVWWPGEDHTTKAGVHLVTVDRPGCGESDPMPGRPVIGWADDVAELATALDAERFGVIGWSGGAPFAAGVAAAIPDRLTGVCLVSSASLACGLDDPELDDDDRHILDLVERYGSREATLRYAEEDQPWAAQVRQDPASLITPSELGPGDAWLLEDPRAVAGFEESVVEAVRQGAIGAASDWVAHVTPWGFSLRDIKIPVRLWHGEQDLGRPVEEAQAVADMIGLGSLTVWPDVGHFGILKNWSAVLEAALG